MTWAQAKQQTVEQWRTLIGRIGREDTIDLLSEVNGVTALCARARELAGAHEDSRKCRYCVVFEQLGGCGAVESALSERLLARDWEAARDLARRVLSDLESLELLEEGGEAS